MSTLGQLYALLGQNPVQPYAEGLKTVLGNERQETAGQTDLLQLAALQRAQETAARERQYYREHPEAALGGGMQSTLGGGMPPAPPVSPLVQQSFGGGQPPGAPQMVPGGQDLSRFAQVPPQGGGPIPPNVMGQVMPQVTPPQSTLGAPGPQQAQQDPLLALMRTDPDAAMAVQGRMQKMQDARLTRTVQETEYVARILQSVKDDAGYGPAKEEIRRVLPQYAAQLPPVYSKEAIDPLVERAIAVGDRAKNAKLEAETRKLDMETRMFPELAKRFGTEGEAPAPAGGDTGQAPAFTGTATAPGTPSRTAPPEYESAITEANRLYPQVSPTRIKSMIAAESNFDAKAVSPAGAQGPMQLMPSTAKQMGVDDPFNVQQNVRGGTRYYAQMLSKYGGDERKALAAYNWGPGNLDKVGGDVTKAPAETQAYVQRVLGGAGGGTQTAPASATDPRLAPLDAKIAQRTRDAKTASLLGNESLSTRLNDDATRLTAEKNRLIDESRHQQERSEEIPRAVKKQTAETEEKQRLERQRQAGPMLPEDRRKFFTGLRTDILKEPTFKVYQDVRNGYQNVKVGAASDSAQGDLAIFNGLAKILDPTSSVMSGEARNIEEAQGQLQRWFNSPQKFLEGDRISKENRPRFLKMAYDLAKEKLTTAQTELKTVYGPLAKEGNIDFDQLVPLSDLKPLEPGPNVSKLDELIHKK